MVVSATTITVAVPSIMDQFGMSQQQVQWLVTGFLASMTSSMLSLAWLVDAFGQRLTFVVGFFVFIVASLLGGFAPSAEAMTVARVIQGAAAGGCLVMAWSVLPYASLLWSWRLAGATLSSCSVGETP